MDALISALQALSVQLLPILGVVVLILLIIFLWRLAKLLKSLDVTIEKTHLTVDLANQSIDKMQNPLDTVVKVSGSIDKAYDAGAKAISQAKEYVANNADILKEKVSSLRNKPEEVIVHKEPSPEDILEEVNNDKQ
jgi:uncharacterized membrane protein YhiD involved in acid resistance